MPVAPSSITVVRSPSASCTCRLNVDVLALESAGENHQWHRGEGGHQREHRVETDHEHEDDRERRDVHDEEHDAEAEEPADDAAVRHRAREQLARLPLVVEGHGQPLQVGVEIVAEGCLEAEGHVAGDPPAGERADALEGTQRQRGQREPEDRAALAVRERPVDHRLDDQWYEGSGAQPQAGAERGDDHLTPVGAEVGPQPPEGVAAHVVPLLRRAGDRRAEGRA
jgi:hypothetical protein